MALTITLSALVSMIKRRSRSTYIESSSSSKLRVFFCIRSGPFGLFSVQQARINIYYTGIPMTSQINPNNIDGTYPVAGQQNNTQGFRDNFTNTKTNFQIAATEITDLENKGVFKAALTGTTLDNNMGDNLIYAVKLNDVSYMYLQQTTTAGSISVDYSAAQYQLIAPTANVSLSFTGWPTSGSQGVMYIDFVVTNTAYTVTLPVAVSLGTLGVQGYAANVITFGATGTYRFAFSTVDSGTTITIYDLNRPLLADSGTAVGYATGAGGTVTQGTSRTTGVTLSKRSGAITLFTAAGTSAYTSFTVTNTLVSATDTIIVNQKSGTNTYLAFVTAVADGSFRITFSSVSGTASDAPVFNFVVIKGVAA
jgi:hypothetical protein